MLAVWKEGQAMIVQAKKEQLDQICRFYQDITDDLERRTNYPLWTWGIHPDYTGLKDAVENNELFLFIPDDFEEILRQKDLFEWSYPFAGGAVVNSSWEDGGEIQWSGDNFSAIHLFAIHPALGKLGLADRFLDEIMKSASKQEIDSIRLDLIEGNWPAGHLYLRHGFESRGKGQFKPEGEKVLNFEYREFIFK